MVGDYSSEMVTCQKSVFKTIYILYIFQNVVYILYILAVVIANKYMPTGQLTFSMV